jgi:hypothetical protein
MESDAISMILLSFDDYSLFSFNNVEVFFEPFSFYLLKNLSKKAK